MAILPMKHIEIIAMQKDAKQIVDLLQQLGTVDVTERDANDVTENLSLFKSQSSLNQLDKTLALVQKSIATVEEFACVKHSLLSGFEELTFFP